MPTRRLIRTILIIIGLIGFCLVPAYRIGYRNVPTVREVASDTVKRAGLQIAGYTGYSWDPFTGGNVWYVAHDQFPSGRSYLVGVSKFRGEIQVWPITTLGTK